MGRAGGDTIRLKKATRYALYAAAEMAAAGEDVVTVGEVASRYKVPFNALAKTFQRLVRGRIAAGTRGVGGGYRLAKDAATISVLDVIEVFERSGRAAGRLSGRGSGGGGGRGATNGAPTDRLGRLFDEVDEIVRSTFASVTLATLVRSPTHATISRAVLAGG